MPLKGIVLATIVHVLSHLHLFFILFRDYAMLMCFSGIIWLNIMENAWKWPGKKINAKYKDLRNKLIVGKEQVQKWLQQKKSWASKICIGIFTEPLPIKLGMVRKLFELPFQWFKPFSITSLLQPIMIFLVQECVSASKTVTR